MIILLLLLALLGGPEEPPNVSGEVVTSDGNAVPPNTCLPRPLTFRGGGPFQFRELEQRGTGKRRFRYRSKPDLGE